MALSLSSINRFFEQVPDRVRQRRALVWSGFIGLSVFLILGLGRVEINMTMESYFSEDDPVKLAYNQFRALFGSDEIAYIVYEPKDGDVFSPQSLNAVRGIQEELLNFREHQPPGMSSLLGHITDVETINNASYMESRGDTLISRDFIGTTLPTTQEERNKLFQQASNHDQYPRLFFSKDARYGGIVIKTDFNAQIVESPTTEQPTEALGLDDEEASVSFVASPNTASSQATAPPLRFRKTSMSEYADFMEAVNTVLQQQKYTDHLIYYPVGNPPLMDFSFKAMSRESGLLMVGLLGLITLVLWLLFRSLSAVVWPVGIIIMSLLWIIGMCGWVGIPLSSMTEILIFLILAVGVADTVHILSGYLYFRLQTQNHEDALRSVYKKSGLACFLTSTTTAVGLTALSVVPIAPIRNFGFQSALGVMLAFAITIFILPLMLDIWQPISKRKAAKVDNSPTRPHLLQRLLLQVEDLSHHYPKQIIALFLVSAVILSIGVFKVQVNTNIIESIVERYPIRHAYRLVDQVMGGTGSMVLMLDTGVNDGAKDPRMLNAVEALQTEIEQRRKDIVIKTFSLVNIAKDSFRALHNGDPTKFVIPQDPDLLAQTLFMFNNANAEDRRHLVTDDYRIMRIGINTTNMGSKQSLEFVDDIHAITQELLMPLKTDFPNLVLTTTGQISMNNRLSDYVSWSQVKSFGITLIVISILLLIIMGSRKLGLIAIIPNLFPMLTIFGLLGFSGVPLDLHVLLVAPITIGIAVDDSIHFLTHFRLEMQIHHDPVQACRMAFREAGQAIIFTSLILSAGFLIFLISCTKGFVFFGLFSSLAIFSALLADLFLLPAILLSVKIPAEAPPAFRHN